MGARCVSESRSPLRPLERHPGSTVPSPPSAAARVAWSSRGPGRLVETRPGSPGRDAARVAWSRRGPGRLVEKRRGGQLPPAPPLVTPTALPPLP